MASLRQTFRQLHRLPIPSSARCITSSFNSLLPCARPVACSNAWTNLVSDRRKFSSVATESDEIVPFEQDASSDIKPEDAVSSELIDILLNNPKKKLRPGIVRRRIENLRVYQGKEKNIRGSPWKLNLVCQFAAGQTVPDALVQLQFVEKAKAPLVQKVIQRTANLASIRDGLLPCQLEVAECFSTHGTPLKRIRYHSKGRFGKMLRRFSHMNVKLREIDFDLKLAQSKTQGELRRWLQRKVLALQEVQMMKSKKDEDLELEKQYTALAEKKRKEKEAENRKK